MTKAIYDESTMAGRIIALREEKNMNTSQLAKAVKIKQPSMWAIETGKTKPENIRASTLMRLAAVLDSSVDYIRDGKGPKHGDAHADVKELVAIFEQAPEHVRNAILAAAKAMHKID